MEGYIKVTEAAGRWGISPRRVRILCAEGRISGVVRKGNLYFIPASATQPVDARTYSKKANRQPYTPLLAEVDALQKRLGTQFKCWEQNTRRSGLADRIYNG